jgi:hypothetical protein
MKRESLILNASRLEAAAILRPVALRLGVVERRLLYSFFHARWFLVKSAQQGSCQPILRLSGYKLVAKYLIFSGKGSFRYSSWSSSLANNS